MKILRLISLLVIISFVSSPSLYSMYKWVAWGDLIQSRQAFRAMAINDHEILVIGGETHGAASSSSRCLNSTEIINVKNHTVTAGPSMTTARAFFQALYDKDSNIIVIGGSSSMSPFTTTNTIEKFNRTTRAWSTLGTMYEGRYQFTAQFINDSVIIAVGGFKNSSSVASNTAELFNIYTGAQVYPIYYPLPVTDEFSGVSSSGDVLVIGGRQCSPGSPKTDKVYKFNKSNNTFTLATHLSDAAHYAPCIKLFNGKLLVYGGCSEDGSPLTLSNQIMLENANGSTPNVLTRVGTLPVPLSHWNAGAQLNDNEVVIAGGFTDDSGVIDFVPNAQVYNVTINDINRTSNLVKPRRRATLAGVNDTTHPANNQQALFLIGGASTPDNVTNYDVTITSIEAFHKSIEPPSVTQISADCYSKTFILIADSADSVALITIDSCDNVTFSYTPNMPSKTITLVASLLDKSKDGSFGIFVKGTNGESGGYGNEIRTPGKITSVSPMTLGVFVMDSTIVNSSTNMNVTANNASEHNTTIITAYLINGTDFSIPSGQFPVAVKLFSSANILVTFTPKNIGMRTDTLVLITACDTFKVAVSGVGITLSADAPVVTAQTSDCATKTYTVQSKDYDIKEIAVVSADNANVTYNPNPPSMTITISANLIDGSKNGSFKIKITTKAGKELYINDAISATSSLSASYPLGKSYYRLDSTGLGRTIYKDVEITNSSSSDLIIDNAYFIYNTEYSVMPSQLPITISANSVGEIKVAFNPTTLKERIDTLYIPQACGIMKIPFNTICKANIYDINGECDAQITTSSSAITPKYLSVSPNPAVNKLKVKMKTAKGAQASNFEIVNSIGESARFTAIISSRCDDGDSETIECQIDISKLNSGVYQLVYNGATRISKSFVVDK